MPSRGLGRGDGICAFGGAPSSEQGEFRGRPPLANAALFAPAPPFPANLLLCKIFAGALPSAHRAVQFAPIRYVSEQFARKPLALRSRLHPQIPSMFVTTKKRADRSRLPFSWSRRRDLIEATGFEPTTSWSRTKRATKLRYASNGEYYIKPNALLQAISMRQFVSYDFFGCFRGGAALPPSAKSAQRTES